MPSRSRLNASRASGRRGGHGRPHVPLIVSWDNAGGGLANLADTLGCGSFRTRRPRLKTNRNPGPFFRFVRSPMTPSATSFLPGHPDPAVASAPLADTIVTIRAQGEGSASLTFTSSDGSLSASQSWSVRTSLAAPWAKRARADAKPTRWSKARVKLRSLIQVAPQSLQSGQVSSPIRSPCNSGSSKRPNPVPCSRRPRLRAPKRPRLRSRDTATRPLGVARARGPGTLEPSESSAAAGGGSSRFPARAAETRIPDPKSLTNGQNPRCSRPRLP